MKRLVSFLLTLVVVSVLACAPALAAPPTHNSIKGIVEEFYLMSCGTDFDVWAKSDEDVYITLYWDNAGGPPVRQAVHVRADLTLYNKLKGPASGITQSSSFNLQIELVNGFIYGSQQTGAVMRFVIPGKGPVFMETGRTTYLWTGTGEWGGLELLTASGQHNWKLHEPVPELCALLQ